MTDCVSQITHDRNRPLGALLDGFHYAYELTLETINGYLNSIGRPILTLDLDSQLELFHLYQNGKVFTNKLMNSILTRCQGMIRSEATFTCQTIAETFKKGFEVNIPFIVAMFL